MALGRYPEGAEALDELLEKFPRTAYTVEAAFDLSKAYAELGGSEPDGDKRFDLFNKSINAMKTVRQHDKSVARRAQVNLEVGRIIELKAAAEIQYGSKARRVEYRDEAIAAYQTIILFESVKEPGVKGFIEEPSASASGSFWKASDGRMPMTMQAAILNCSRAASINLRPRTARSRARAKLAATGQVPVSRASDSSTVPEAESLSTKGDTP